MTKTCVLVIDLQCAFIDPRYSATGRLEKSICLPGVRQLLAHSHSRGWPLIHVITVHPAEGPFPRHLEKLGITPYCIRGDPGTDVVAGLIRPGDIVLEKTSYSAFSNARLRKEISAFDNVILAGVAVDCCVLSTAMDASGHYRKSVFLPYEAAAAANRDDYLHGLRIIAKSAGAVVSLSDIARSHNDLWASRIADKDIVGGPPDHWYESLSQKVKRFDNSNSDRDSQQVIQELEMLLQSP